MDLLAGFSIDNAAYFTIQLIIAVAAFGFLIFSFLVSRQVQLMNRVLTTKLASVFQLISLAFVFGSGAIFVLCTLALFA